MLRRFRLLRRLKVLATTAALTTVISPAHADWRDDIGTFRIGIVAEPGAGNTVPGLSALTRAYSMALGMKVEFLVAPVASYVHDWISVRRAVDWRLFRMESRLHSAGREAGSDRNALKL